MKVFSKLLATVLLISAGSAFFSCIKKKEYPIVPLIEYKDLIRYGKDSADVVFTFKDGDGDIGYDQKDTFPPFNPSSVYYSNFYMRYLYKNSAGDFVEYVYLVPPLHKVKDTLNWAYRIPNITPNGQNKVLDGEIKVRLYAPYFEHTHT